MDSGKIIKTKGKYESTIARIKIWMDAAPGSPELRELELLIWKNIRNHRRLN
jgi:hypothetical protein